LAIPAQSGVDRMELTEITMSLASLPERIAKTFTRLFAAKKFSAPEVSWPQTLAEFKVHPAAPAAR
jgi:hypothetical protein